MPVLMPAASMPLTESGFSHPVPVLIQVPHVTPSSTHCSSFAGSTAASAAAEASAATKTPPAPGGAARRAIHCSACCLCLLALDHWTDAQAIQHPGSRLPSLPSYRFGRCSADGGTEPGAWNSASAVTLPCPGLALVEPVGTAVDSDGETPVVFPGLPAARRQPRGAGP